MSRPYSFAGRNAGTRLVPHGVDTNMLWGSLHPLGPCRDRKARRARAKAAKLSRRANRGR